MYAEKRKGVPWRTVSGLGRTGSRGSGQVMTEGRCPRSGVTGSKTARRDPDSTGSGGMTSAGSRQGATDDGSRLNGGTGSNRMGRGTGSEDTHPANPRPAFSQCRRPSRDSRGTAAGFGPPAPQPPYQPPRRGKSWPARHKALTGLLAFGALIIIIVAANAGKSPSSPGSNVAAVGTTSCLGDCYRSAQSARHAARAGRAEDTSNEDADNLGRVTRAGAVRAGAIRASAYDCRGGGRAASFRGAS